MKSAVFTKTSAGKVLQIAEFPAPIPKHNEVLLKVRASSINPLDWRMKSSRPGVDVAGVVDRIGKEVKQLKPGDAVFGTGKGAFAEYACAAETALVIKPDKLSFEQAAAVPIAGLTALQGLRDKGHLQPGQKVLINGAAGGVGTFAVQLAKCFGAHVTAVCSTRNLEQSRSLGADRVIDYTHEDFTKEFQSYDLVLDNVGNIPLSSCKRILAPHGRCILVGAPKQLWAIAARILSANARSLLLRQRFTFFIAKIIKADLTFLCDLMQDGKLTPVIDRPFPLSQAAEAIAYVEQGHARSKVVITT